MCLFASRQDNEKAHHDKYCQDKAPSRRKAESTGKVGKEQGEPGDKQTVGQLCANVLYEVARAENGAHNCRVGDRRAAVAENCTVQHSTHAYHSGKTIGLSVKLEGDRNGSGDEDGHRPIACACGK